MVGTESQPRRICLAHDWLVSLRGGEWVLDRLAQRYGPTTIATLVANGSPITPAIDACTIRTSFIQRLPGGSGRLRRACLPLMPLAVGQLTVPPCDLLISTSSAVMKAVRPPAHTPHLCYCHSPARYIWEQGDEYAVGKGGALRKLGLDLVRARFKAWDVRTTSRVTRFLANSNHTAARIRRCFDREAHVVYPPVRTEYYTLDHNTQREDFLLVVSALEPYKRTDLVVDAAVKAGRPLKVAGSGSQLNALRAHAPKNVEFLGRVSDEQLRSLYQRAHALVFPQQEDFGIVAVEAQAAGCPVIAFNAGGAQESVANDTGTFFDEQTIDALADAITQHQRRSINPEDCRANAERFSERAFDHAIAQHADELIDEGRISN